MTVEVAECDRHRERIRDLEKACMDSAMATAWGYCDMWRKGAQVEADLDEDQNDEAPA